MGIPSTEFITRTGGTKKDYDYFLKVWKKNKALAKVFLGHCRNGTKGDAVDNNNNHPIRVGEIVGVHNGKIDNDKAIFEKLKCGRDGEVDSEAIFRLLHHYTKNGTEPFTTKMIQEVVHRLAGPYAVMTFSGNNPYQMAMFRDGRPVEMLLIKKLGIVICASEDKIMKQAIFRYNKMSSLYEAGFPELEEDDLELKQMPDDSAIVFDLRTEITKKTDLADLYDWEKMSRTKYWGTAPTYTSYGTGKSTTNKSTVNAKSPTKPKTTTQTPSTKNKVTVPPGNGDDDEEPGRIWSKADGAYKTEDLKGIDDSNKMRNVELDIDENSLTEIDKITSTDDEGGLKKQGEEVEDLIGDAANIEEIDPSTGKTTEIDVTVDAEAMEAAEEAVGKEEMFEKAEEVLDALDVKDLRTLEALDIVALANRMKKRLGKDIFAKGYATRRGQELAGDEKYREAQKNIIAVKTFTKVIMRILKEKNVKIGDDALSKAIAEAMESKEGLSSISLDKVFKPGDERELDLIKTTKKVLRSKEGR
jgi:hypothetical protein